MKMRIIMGINIKNGNDREREIKHKKKVIFILLIYCLAQRDSGLRKLKTLK